MGSIFTNMFNKMFKNKDARVLMLGLDSAGKTTILYKMKLGETVNSVPTIGFNVDTVKFQGCSLDIWDVGGQTEIRALWRHYFPKTEAVIFVVDSADNDRIELARDELHKLLADEDLQNIFLLVFANKQDIATMSVSEVSQKLNLQSIKHIKWFCQGTNGLTGDGLHEGMNKLVKEMNNRQ